MRSFELGVVECQLYRYSDDSPKEWYRQLSGRASASPESLGRGLVRRQRHSSGDTGTVWGEAVYMVNYMCR